ncbi:MAG TPA: hypothetical protein VFX96_09890 [Pyrinomonadaceae bacterium]|nr:hypothetical protein [Pyrinomonadaceae bacterium]
MNDDRDFFDDLIDVDSEVEEESFDDEEEGFDDDEEEDDAEPAEVRTAVLSKNGMLALLTLRKSAAGSQIVRVDPRQPAPVARRYEDGEAATHWFRRSLATSRNNGWSVEYDGAPLFG